MAKITSAEKSMSIARRFRESLVLFGVTPERVVLFGSQAKNNAQSYSDIDICVVSNQFGRNPIAELLQLKKIALLIDSSIEPVPLHPKDFNDKYSTLISEIKRYGKDVPAKKF